MKWIKTFESYNDQSEFFSEVIDILKKNSTRPIDINQIIEFYKDQITNYFNDGKSPQQFVDDNLSDFSGNDRQMVGVKFPKRWSGELKYL